MLSLSNMNVFGISNPTWWTFTNLCFLIVAYFATLKEKALLVYLVRKVVHIEWVLNEFCELVDSLALLVYTGRPLENARRCSINGLTLITTLNVASNKFSIVVFQLSNMRKLLAGVGILSQPGYHASRYKTTQCYDRSRSSEGSCCWLSYRACVLMLRVKQ